MAIHTLSFGFQRNGESIGSAVSVTVEGEENRDLEIAASQTDKQVIYHLDISQLQTFYIVSSRPVTVKTNSTSAPDDQLDLLADQPMTWYAGDADNGLPALFSADITALYITTPSGAASVIQIRAGFDATP